MEGSDHPHYERAWHVEKEGNLNWTFNMWTIYTIMGTKRRHVYDQKETVEISRHIMREKGLDNLTHTGHTDDKRINGKHYIDCFPLLLLPSVYPILSSVWPI